MVQCGDYAKGNHVETHWSHVLSWRYQRFHYNNYIMGSGGAMTPKRIELLQAIWFSFEMVSSSWLTKLEKLKECARIHGTDVNSIPRLSRSSGARAKRSESEKLLLQLNTWATVRRSPMDVHRLTISSPEFTHASSMLHLPLETPGTA